MDSQLALEHGLSCAVYDAAPASSARVEFRRPWSYTRPYYMAAPNWANRTLFHGDNMDVLRSMNSDTVDLIATDPPFNKRRDFHATPDSLAKGARFQDRWTWEDIHEEWKDTINNDNRSLAEAIESARFAHSEGMGAYMCFMAVRLMEMRRVLKPTGSIYLHCDPTASHYLKACMDAIFGYRRLRNEIVWSYRSGGGSKRQFGKKHDSLFWYCKGRTWVFNADAVRVPYDAKITKSRRKHFHEKGKVAGSVWDISRPPNHSSEWLGYPTQKPLALYERIIKASSNKGDIVLDPFAGCATTCVAAERLDRRWVGIDIWPKTHEAVLARFRRLGYSINGEHGEASQMFSFGDVSYTDRLPDRTDEGERAGAKLATIWDWRRTKEPWQKLTNRQMKEHLAVWQRSGSSDLITCAGCGRQLEQEFMQLDHITPRRGRAGGFQAPNSIDNRILLCGPCNRKKSNVFTLDGLRRQNLKDGWMRDHNLAEHADKGMQKGFDVLVRNSKNPLEPS